MEKSSFNLRKERMDHINRIAKLTNLVMSLDNVLEDAIESLEKGEKVQGLEYARSMIDRTVNY